MEPGTIKIAEHDGVYVIRMEGDVRLTLCLSFDSFIDSMLNAPDFCSVMFDLSDAEAVDSTTLGLMAKISILSKKLCPEPPIVVTHSPGIKRLLVSMGFEDIFNIVEQADLPVIAQESLPEHNNDENLVKQKVIDAHRVLMDMNEKNSDAFKELVETLESDQFN